MAATATFAMHSAGNSASALGRGIQVASSDDSGTYKVVLPRLPSGSTVLNSVFLHADLSGRPYRAPDFRDALLAVLNTSDILACGQYQMSHLWLVTCVNGAAKQKLVERGELTVKGLKCLVIDPESRNIKMKLLWLSPHIEQRRIVEALEPYGTVQSITREMWRCDGMEAWQMTNRDVSFTLKDGISVNSLPHLLDVYGQQSLILIPGRPPLCLRCNRVGHIRRQCKTPRCKKCHRYGHVSSACVQTYADKLRSGREAEDDTVASHIMDASEVVDSSGEAVAEQRREDRAPSVPTEDASRLVPPEDQGGGANVAVLSATWAESPTYLDRPPSTENEEMELDIGTKKRPAPLDDVEASGGKPEVMEIKQAKKFLVRDASDPAPAASAVLSTALAPGATSPSDIGNTGLISSEAPLVADPASSSGAGLAASPAAGSATTGRRPAARPPDPDGTVGGRGKDATLL